MSISLLFSNIQLHPVLPLGPSDRRRQQQWNVTGQKIDRMKEERKIERKKDSRLNSPDLLHDDCKTSTFSFQPRVTKEAGSAAG